jgi:hypothetical protein
VSQLVSRILLAMLMFPLAILVLIVTGVSFDKVVGYTPEDTIVFVVSGVTWAFVAVYWILVWRTTVHWTSLRMILTASAALGALVAGIIVGLVFNGIERHFGSFVGAASAPLLWLVATVLIWRETAAERMERLKSSADAIVCPTCGYNLTGLTGTRCPECGTQFTLTELLASQPNKAAVELE